MPKEKQVKGYTLTKISRSTKKAERYINSYNCSVDYSLSHCYKSYSDEKEKTMAHYIETLEAIGGERGRIISHSIKSFTYGFKAKNDLIIVTERNNYLIEGVF